MGKNLSQRTLNVVNTTAYRMRRWPAIHQPARWLRRTLWAALVEGFWEFARCLFVNSKRFGPPAKTFSVYQELRCGWPRINGRIVLHDQGAPKGVTGDSLLVRSGMEQHLLQPWPVFWSEHANVRLVTASLVFLSPEKELCVESAYGQRFWRHDSGSRFLRLPAPVKLSGNWTSVVSRWVPNRSYSIYGHWLHDAIPRLLLLSEFPPDTKIIVPADLKPYQKESLELLGVWDRCRPTPERHLEIENYFFSSPVSMIDGYNPYAVHNTRKALLPKADPNFSGPKKFFFHRSGKSRAVDNIAEIHGFFRQQGWAIVNDVELTFAQTIKLFSEADAICSFVGSNMSNVIFCKPGCLVMHLVTDAWLDGWIDWIAQVVELNYHPAVFLTGGPMTPRIVIDITQVEKLFTTATA